MLIEEKDNDNCDLSHSCPFTSNWSEASMFFIFIFKAPFSLDQFKSAEQNKQIHYVRVCE